jgi:hypothetical protein
MLELFCLRHLDSEVELPVLLPVPVEEYLAAGEPRLQGQPYLTSVPQRQNDFKGGWAWTMNYTEPYMSAFL